MEFREAIRIAFQSLWANKMRTVLTMIGVIIGVASVIAVITLSNGAKMYVIQKIANHGSDTLTITRLTRNAGATINFTAGSGQVLGSSASVVFTSAPTTVNSIILGATTTDATTIAVTNFPWSPITEVADYVLLTAARETAFRSGAMTSRIAQLTVVDCLFITLAQQDLPTTRLALEKTFAAAQAKRVRKTRRSRREDE